MIRWVSKYKYIHSYNIIHKCEWYWTLNTFSLLALSTYLPTYLLSFCTFCLFLYVALLQKHYEPDKKKSERKLSILISVTSSIYTTSPSIFFCCFFVYKFVSDFSFLQSFAANKILKVYKRDELDAFLWYNCFGIPLNLMPAFIIL